MILFLLRALAQGVFGRFRIRAERPRVVGGLDVSVPEFLPSSRGGAFHTVFGNIRAPKMEYDERELVGDVVVDWLIPRSPRGVVVVFHGMGGSSCSPGVKRLVLAVSRRGYAAAVFNRRGHASTTPLQGGFPDHANDDDTRMVVEHVASRGYPVYGIGLSAGANAMIRTLDGETPIRAAVSVCGPLDLNLVYEKLCPKMDSMLTSWVMDVYARHRARFRARSMREFDEFVTGRRLDEYYEEQGSVEALRITPVPTMCLGTENDPIVDKCVLDLHDEIARGNPNVVSVRTREGGHCGWVERTGEWMESFAMDFIDSVASGAFRRSSS